MAQPWASPMPIREDGGPAPFASNAEILAAWEQSPDLNGRAGNTREAYVCDVRPFTEAWGPVLVTRLAQADLQAYTDRLHTKCRNLRRAPRQSGVPFRCHLGKDITKCPLLAGRAPSACSDYKPLKANTVAGSLYAIATLYDWLEDHGYVKANPVRRVIERFNTAHIGELRPAGGLPVRREVTPEEVRKIVRLAPIWLAAFIAFQCLAGARLHEAVKMRITTKQDFDLEAGWALIPAEGRHDRRQGAKRQGNHLLVISDELRTILRMYLRWREKYVRRDENGRELTKALFINPEGRPWSDVRWEQEINKAIKRVCVRAGLVTGKETELSQKITSHCFRGVFTTWLNDHDCPGVWNLILRGDRQPGALENYNHFKRKLREKYEIHGPKLQLDACITPTDALAAA